MIFPLADAVSAGDSESVTVTVIGGAGGGPLVAAVGVPVIAPVDAFSVRPAGRLPAVIVNL